jgi:hypothetical protein
MEDEPRTPPEPSPGSAEGDSREAEHQAAIDLSESGRKGMYLLPTTELLPADFQDVIDQVADGAEPSGSIAEPMTDPSAPEAPAEDG